MSWLNDGTATGIASLGNGILGLVQNERNIAFQKQMNEQNWQRQREFIDDERAYNDPKEQMKRLEAAGINTTFAGMNPSISGGSDVGSQSPLQGVAPMSTANLDSMSSGLALSAELSQSKALNDSNVALNEAQIEVYKSTCDKIFNDIQQGNKNLEIMQKQLKKLDREISFIGTQEYKTFQEANWQEILNRAHRWEATEGDIKLDMIDSCKAYYNFHKPELNSFFRSPETFAYAFAPRLTDAINLSLGLRGMDVAEKNAESNRLGASASMLSAQTAKETAKHQNGLLDASTFKTTVEAALHGQVFKMYQDNPELLQWSSGLQNKASQELSSKVAKFQGRMQAIGTLTNFIGSPSQMMDNMFGVFNTALGSKKR